jgi:hypothetical protein
MEEVFCLKRERFGNEGIQVKRGRVRGGTHPPSKWIIIKRKELCEEHFVSC